MKSKTIFACTNCGATSARWAGKCPMCGEWNTFVEEKQVSISTGKVAGRSSNERAKIQKLSEVEGDHTIRIKTGIVELDRVLGGGITPGSLVLVGGDPGIGKSTLMLQMCAGLAKNPPLYISGEESLHQIKLRAARLHNIPDNLMLLPETNIEAIIDSIKATDCNVIIVDSIQTVFSENIESTPGSIVQVRECAALLMQTAKQNNKAIFIIGHVTKEGAIAGPKVLEHMVDTVLQFEGEKLYAYRILRALKNRFGSTNEIGIFEMAEEGLREVLNPSELFLSERRHKESGTAIVAAMEGSRPLLIEVQALATPTGYSVPQRMATGFDYKRLQMIVAVLEKRLGVQLRQHDVFVNVAGGISLNDPAVDIGVAAALVSSLRDTPVDSHTVLIGEIGLTGEVRSVPAIEQRIMEAQKLGFKNVVIPQGNFKKVPRSVTIGVKSVERISLAFAELFA
ncbi:MAG: DNA repair protein RadA [Bacteroidota bacterium]